MKSADNPIPILTKEWEDRAQLASWEKSGPGWFAGHIEKQTGANRTLRLTTPIKINNNRFLLFVFNLFEPFRRLRIPGVRMMHPAHHENMG